MFCELAARLYKLRDDDPSALEEYDAACNAHDGEIGEIRAALVAKFGKVPLLETYKQQTIRQQMAHNWAEGLRWAQRGLEVYGAEASNNGWVDDLRKRASYCQAKLEAPPPRPKAAPKTVENTVSPIETLTCTRCGTTWERARVRGRKPLLCESCCAIVIA